MGRLAPFAAAAAVILAASAALADDEVVLQSGEILKGRIVERNDIEVVLDHPVLGKVTIPAGRVKSAVREGEKPPPEAPRWKSKFEAGMSGAEGNTDTLSATLGLVADLDKPRDLWHFETRYFLKETDGETTESRYYALLRKDWRFEKGTRYTFFAEGRYDRDQFQQWDQRATAAAGVTYKFIEKERLFVAFRVGGAATKEWGVERTPADPSPDTDVRPEGLLGVEMKWKIDDTKEFTAQSTYYPDLSDLPEYRTLSSAGISIRLDDKGAWSFRAGVEHEYDTHRMEPFKRTDVRYFALLVVEF
jgi:putative salt-induced outer membrane protein YdiY